MSTAEAKTYSPSELLTMPDGDRYELVDGQLVERNMSVWSSYVARRILEFLVDFCKTQPGWVFGEGTSYQCFPDDPNKVRKADASYIRLSRLTVEQAQQPGHLRIAPDLALEVISPNDLAYDTDHKVMEYRSAGVPLAWVVNPDARTVEVHRTEGTSIILHKEDELSGDEILPGFRCRIAELFQPPTSN